MQAPTTVRLEDIQAAARRIAGSVDISPCIESEALSALTGCRVFCKLDNLQRTGSFKERGARNAMMVLDDARRKQGVIAASAGNHALALAYHGRQLAIPVTVVMPIFAPLIKVARCRQYGARVVIHGQSFEDARAHANSLASEQGLTYIHGYDDPYIIAGQGTIGLEIADQVPDVSAVIVPVGGGGLIAGIAAALKPANPHVRIIGVEPQRAAAFTAARAAGSPVKIDCLPTLADGLAVGKVGDLAFRIANPLVDRMVQVDEKSLSLAILRLIELEKAVVEGAGASPLAALLSGQLDDLRGTSVVLPLCGGNIDPLALRRVIEHGLAHDHRLHRFAVTISDRPGGLAKLTQIIAESRASIQDIYHDRIFAGPDVAQVRAQVVVETRDLAHFQQLLQSLNSAGIVTEPLA